MHTSNINQSSSYYSRIESVGFVCLPERKKKIIKLDPLNFIQNNKTVNHISILLSSKNKNKF